MEQRPSYLREHRKGLLIALALLLALVAGVIVYCTRPQPLMEAPAPGAWLLEASQGLDDVTIDARYQPATRTLTVTQRMRLVNRTDQALSDVVLRAYPNALEQQATSPAAESTQYHRCYPEGFSPGKLDVNALRVNGAAATYAYTDDARTVLRVALDAPWQPDAELALETSYAVLLPKAAFRMGVYQEIASVGNAFLLPSVWQDGAWRADPYYAAGDPFLSECRNYHVAVTVPEGYRMGGSGYALAESGPEGDVYRMEALAARDFAFCVSDQYAVSQAMADDVLVTAMARSKADADWMADMGVKGLRYLEGLLGPYPYPTFTLCEVDFSFGGMEYPAFTMIATEQLQQKSTENARMVVTHEVAHQWFYAVVGSDEIEQPWQDESLCQYVMLRWAEDTHGAYLRESLEEGIDSAYWLTLGSEVTPGMPVYLYPDLLSYSIAVYQQGVGLFTALEAYLGKEELGDFLRAYYREFAFRLCTRPQFEAFLNEQTGEDLSPLMIDYLDTLPM